MANFKFTIKEVPIGKMEVAEASQRPFNEARINELLSDFDLDLIGRPIVSERGGHYYIIDGQHRVRALRAFLGPGWEKQKIQCTVYHDLTENDEADLFLRYNNTLNVQAYSKFKVAVTAGRPDEVAITRVVRSNGLKIAQTRKEGGISAVGTLRKVYKRSDEMVLGRTLRLIRDAYGDIGLEGSVIDGLAHVCQRYNGTLDEQTAKEKLGSARGGVKGLLNRATELRLRTGNQMPICIAAAAVDIINSGKGGHKIPSWWAEAE